MAKFNAKVRMDGEFEILLSKIGRHTNFSFRSWKSVGNSQSHPIEMIVYFETEINHCRITTRA
jgi:hypothetical protein